MPRPGAKEVKPVHLLALALSAALIAAVAIAPASQGAPSAHAAKSCKKGKKAPAAKKCKKKKKNGSGGSGGPGSTPGAGTTTLFSVTPTSYDFGGVAQGSGGADKDFTVQMTSSTAVGPITTEVTSSTPDAFQIPVGCDAGLLQPPYHTSCNFTVHFESSSGGPNFTGSVKVSGYPSAPVTVALAGHRSP